MNDCVNASSVNDCVNASSVNDCVNASSVNMFTNRIDRYMARSGYTYMITLLDSR